MDVNEKLAELGVSLGASLARNTALNIQERVRAQRARGDDKATIEELSQIIGELIEDKSDITRIAQAYQAELVSQRMTPGDIAYITSNVLPVVQELAVASGKEAELEQILPALQSLLSIEVVNVLQLLGFDFRRAIGEPLTHLVAMSIEARTPEDPASRVKTARLQAQRELALMDLARHPKALARFARLVGREDLL
ncbi:hypothetical protein GCM10009846_03970 [Agrococcus versicolor]|uniref:Uncharacterized protein n=1 Tax=Agrococcus versicolor TaxID=501482 RepID=A0ABP5M9R8_9MICO